MTDEKKIISINELRKKKANADTDPIPTEPEFSFEEQMERNRKLAERKAKERLDANKSVLRSYRIKH